VAGLLNKTTSELPNTAELNDQQQQQQQQEGAGERERVYAVEEALIDRLPKVSKDCYYPR
jgi:hypothetical protein